MSTVAFSMVVPGATITLAPTRACRAGSLGLIPLTGGVCASAAEKEVVWATASARSAEARVEGMEGIVRDRPCVPAPDATTASIEGEKDRQRKAPRSRCVRGA